MHTHTHTRACANHRERQQRSLTHTRKQTRLHTYTQTRTIVVRRSFCLSLTQIYVDAFTHTHTMYFSSFPSRIKWWKEFSTPFNCDTPEFVWNYTHLILIMPGKKVNNTCVSPSNSLAAFVLFIFWSGINHTSCLHNYLLYKRI